METNQITVVKVHDEDLWHGAKVKNLRNGKIKEIYVIPEGKTISKLVTEGLFDLEKHVDYSTFMLNKRLFELVDEE